MRKSFWSLIWGSFLKSQGVLVGLLAFVAAIIFWVYPPTFVISLKFVVPIFILLLLLIFTLVTATYDSYRAGLRILPRLIVSKNIGQNKDEIRILCVLEPSELFSYDSVVSFYCHDEGFEQLIGVGTVINIQEDGKIQVVMTNFLKEHEEKVRKLAMNDAGLLQKTVVKPNVPKTHFDLFSQGGM